MSEKLTRDINSLMKSLSDVQMEGELPFFRKGDSLIHKQFWSTTFNKQILKKIIGLHNRHIKRCFFSGLNSNQTIWEEVEELKATLQLRILVNDLS